MAAINSSKYFDAGDSGTSSSYGQTPLEERVDVPEDERKENEPQNSQARNRYYEWRKSGIPSFEFSPLPVDLSRVPNEQRQIVRERCLEQYKRSSESFDQSIADAALSYVRKEGDPASNQAGPLLEMARKFSGRVYDLYKIYCAYEIEQDIPMIPVDAGQLKNHGFISAEIVQMQESCARFMRIWEALAAATPEENREDLFRILASPERRQKLVESREESPLLIKAIREYEALNEKGLIDRACFMMFQFGHLNVKEVELQLWAIARMRPYFGASLENRIQMEIRHRVAGEGRAVYVSPGFHGSDPLVYQNLIRRGNPEHPEAEFRGLMYFVYMNNHFINACMRENQFIQFANGKLESAGADWRIDPEYILAMESREPKFLPPIFRYGQNAALNSWIREYHSNPVFYERNPSPLLTEVMDGRCSPDSNFRHRLSMRELMSQIGDFRSEKISSHARVKMDSGGAKFRIRGIEEIDNSPKGNAAKQYVAMCQELRLPSLASISGTFDQMAAMAGFVGTAVSPEELETLKVGMIAFMVPARDHSVHEILQSSKSYDLPYEPGPGFERFVYPSEGERFLNRIQAEVNRRNEQFPIFYLSAEHAERVFRETVLNNQG